MRRFSFLACLLLAGCATAPTEVKRLSPVILTSSVPKQCQVVSVLKDSPAQKAGLALGDVLKSVNGQVPADAAALSDLVLVAPQDSSFEVQKKGGTSQNVKVHLNAGRPRLGTVCDLSGWEKLGVTVAGNESVTVFDGPFAMTASGIVDKGIVFLRVRLTNNMDKPLEVGPKLFKVADASGVAYPLLSPKDVMCFLYGDKGAHLLALKKKHKETLDASESMGDSERGSEDRCPEGTKPYMKSPDPKYVEANAQYLATESLWPTVYQPASVADGLLYIKETSSLPVEVTASVEGRTLAVKLGNAIANEKQMKRSELVPFFESQKRGNALRLTLRKGKVFVAKFSSYDSNEERVWFDTPSGGMLNTTSFSIENIRYAEPLEQVPAKPTPSPSDLN